MSVIKPGFRGFAVVENYYDANGDIQPMGNIGSLSPPFFVRFNSCDVNPAQEIEAPDMVMGDDTHDAWAFGKIEVAGGISGPITESTGYFMAALDTYTAEPYSGVELKVKYYEGYTKGFSGIRLNSFNVTVTAGEVANFTLNLIGTGVTADPTGDVMRGFTIGEKLVTWDKASLRIFTAADIDPNDADPYTGPVDGQPVDDETSTWIDNGSWPDDPRIVGPPGPLFDTLYFGEFLESFNIEASRNITRRFILGNSSLFGDLVEGMKSVTGQVSSYTVRQGEGLGRGADYWNQYLGDRAYPIRLDIGNNVSIKAGVRFQRSTTTLDTGPVIGTLAFKGVTHHGRGALEVS